ncbi:MAG: hypothetical protein WC655_27910 [Candidatus Hydrogenedentales bacterium]|jgi:hypothetical protein
MTRYLAFASEYHLFSEADKARISVILPDDGTYASRVAALAHYYDFEAKPDDDGDRNQQDECERGFLK